MAAPPQTRAKSLSQTRPRPQAAPCDEAVQASACEPLARALAAEARQGAALAAASRHQFSEGASTPPVDWCSELALDLDGQCVNVGRSSIYNLGANDDDGTLPPGVWEGFKLTADPDHALHFMGNSFDDQHTTKGNITPRNVCALALYGNRAASYTNQGIWR